MTNTDFELTELHRRLANMIRFGCVVATDYGGAVPRVKVATGELETAWLPLITPRAGKDSSTWLLDIDEQVVVLSPSGELAQGVVLGSMHQQRFPSLADSVDQHCTQYRDGAIINYNNKIHHLDVSLPSGATINILAEGGLTISGDVTIHGNLQASGHIADHTRSMQDDRTIFNQHTHAGVKTGEGSTLPPDATQ
jgi:phage baseplate assembly protein V